MKKFLSLVCLVCVMALALGSMVACQNNEQATGKLSFHEALDCSVVGGIGLLGADDTKTVMIEGFNVSLMSDEENDGEEKEEKEADTSEKVELTEELKQEILKNLKIAENTVSGGFTKSETKEVNENGYKYLYTLKVPTVDGENVEYKFYFNTNEKIETDDEDGKDDDEKEEEISLQGIVVLDGVEYKVDGKREIEGEESEITFKISLSESKYVVIKNEIEKNENEYSYELVENGETVYETEVEYEVGENGEIEISFESESNGEELEYSYKFIKEGDINKVVVEIEKNEKETEVTLIGKVGADGKITYEFEA